MTDFILPNNHISEYNDKVYNWFVGDHVTYPKVIKDTFWAFAIPKEKGWNTIHAEYCGKFNYMTREIYEINKLNNNQ